MLVFLWRNFSWNSQSKTEICSLKHVLIFILCFCNHWTLPCDNFFYWWLILSFSFFYFVIVLMFLWCFCNVILMYLNWYFISLSQSLVHRVCVFIWVFYRYILNMVPMLHCVRLSGYCMLTWWREYKENEIRVFYRYILNVALWDCQGTLRYNIFQEITTIE